MILFEEALNIVKSTIVRLTSEPVDFLNSLDRILAEDVFSDIDMPPFNKSAVDGYACRKEDLEKDLKVIETIPAGAAPEKLIGKGQCSKIMTGGMVPAGSDTVIMVEDVEIISEGYIRFRETGTSSNIAYQGEDIRKGELVLQKGKMLRPQDIAILASVGHIKPKLSLKPHVGIISTGDELVEPSQVPTGAQIRNSNAWQLMAQAGKAGCEVSYFGIAADDEAALAELIKSAEASSDIILITGGVSVGDFDFVPEVIHKSGYETLFHKIAVQPGKPTLFATKKNKFLFGLPGNPVSSFVQFELLVRSLIKTITGSVEKEPVVALQLDAEISRRRTERKAFIPVTITENHTIVPIEYHGSAHIHSFAEADGIISFEIGQAQIKKGTYLNVRLI